MAATGVKEQSVAFAAKHLKKNPDMSMSELKALGSKEGINIYPLIIGLANKSLGRSKPKRGKSGRGPGRPPGKRGPGRPPGKRGPGRPPGRRGPGRPPKSADPASALQGIVAHMRELEREVASLRGALAKISDIAAG